MRLFACRLPSVKSTEYSSSSWWSTSRRRWSDWILEIERSSSERFCAISTLVWHYVEKKNGKRRRQQKKMFQYCTDPSGQSILYLRALWGHSGRNLIDPSLQDNVLIPDDFFEYICHTGCAINLHTIMNSELIPGGQNVRKRQTVFFMSVDPMNKEHRDPNKIDMEAPRLAWYHQKKWKKHQNTVYWVDIKLAQKKWFKFYQTRSNAIILYDTLPACWIPKAIKMGTGEIIYEKVYMSPRPPPKISFLDNWRKELGSEVAGGGEDSQQTQLIQEIDKDVLFGCQTRTERPVGGQESTKVEELDIDCREPGLSHAVVKEAEHFRVQELVKKRSKVILVEKHFKPTCSRITSTTHSTKIRRRWSANWVMWSYSGCAKLYQKYNVLTVFFIEIKELSAAFADNAWLTATPEESLTN